MDVVPYAFPLQFTTMHDCVGVFSLGSQRGTISVFPVFLFTKFAHASHTRASSGRFWTICSPTHGFLLSMLLASCTHWLENLKSRGDILWSCSESACPLQSFFYCSYCNYQMERVAEATTPLIATKCTCAMVTFSLCSNVATGLLTGMIKNRPRLSLH